MYAQKHLRVVSACLNSRTTEASLGSFRRTNISLELAAPLVSIQWWHLKQEGVLPTVPNELLRDLLQELERGGWLQQRRRHAFQVCLSRLHDPAWKTRIAARCLDPAAPDDDTGTCWIFQSKPADVIAAELKRECSSALRHALLSAAVAAADPWLAIARFLRQNVIIARSALPVSWGVGSSGNWTPSANVGRGVLSHSTTPTDLLLRRGLQEVGVWVTALAKLCRDQPRTASDRCCQGSTSLLQHATAAAKVVGLGGYYLGQEEAFKQFTGRRLPPRDHWMNADLASRATQLCECMVDFMQVSDFCQGWSSSLLLLRPREGGGGGGVSEPFPWMRLRVHRMIRRLYHVAEQLWNCTCRQFRIFVPGEGGIPPFSSSYFGARCTREEFQAKMSRGMSTGKPEQRRRIVEAWSRLQSFKRTPAAAAAGDDASSSPQPASSPTRIWPHIIRSCANFCKHEGDLDIQGVWARPGSSGNIPVRVEVLSGSSSSSGGDDAEFVLCMRVPTPTRRNPVFWSVLGSVRAAIEEEWALLEALNSAEESAAGHTWREDGTRSLPLKMAF